MKNLLNETRYAVTHLQNTKRVWECVFSVDDLAKLCMDITRLGYKITLVEAQRFNFEDRSWHPIWEVIG